VIHVVLEIEQRRYPITRTTVVRPVGELSIASMSVLRSALRRAVRGDAAVIVVDLARTSVQDAAMAVPLVEAARLGRAFGAEVVVATAPEQLAGRLASCGLVDRRKRRPAASAPLPGSPVRRRPPGSRRRGES
jgi:anti-anti-sigma regulatory factor